MSVSFTVSVQNACMHGTDGNKYLEAGQTAGYDGYKLIGQSVDITQFMAWRLKKSAALRGAPQTL